MVISREMSDCQSPAAALTSVTAPTVRQDRKVMMAMTNSSARPATERAGTIGLVADELSKPMVPPLGSRPSASANASSSSSSRDLRRKKRTIGLLGDLQPAVEQDQPACIHLVHEPDVMGGDHHRCAEPVELEEQPQEPPRQRRVDIARGLVGEQHFRLGDQRPGDRRALLLAA